jgi:hypothetical protein
MIKMDGMRLHPETVSSRRSPTTSWKMGLSYLALILQAEYRISPSYTAVLNMKACTNHSKPISFVNQVANGVDDLPRKSPLQYPLPALTQDDMMLDI